MIKAGSRSLTEATDSKARSRKKTLNEAISHQDLTKMQGLLSRLPGSVYYKYFEHPRSHGLTRISISRIEVLEIVSGNVVRAKDQWSDSSYYVDSTKVTTGVKVISDIIEEYASNPKDIRVAATAALKRNYKALSSPSGYFSDADLAKFLSKYPTEAAFLKAAQPTLAQLTA